MTELLTDLTLCPVGGEASILTLLSSRNCTQILTPIPHGKLRRTVNGRLIHTGLPHHIKYGSVIKGVDKAPPALENVWKGSVFEVGCLQHLTQPIRRGEESLELSRNPVPRSVFITDGEGEAHTPEVGDHRRVILPRDVTHGYVSYRPLLEMCVIEFQLTTDEWGMSAGWTLKLVER